MASFSENRSLDIVLIFRRIRISKPHIERALEACAGNKRRRRCLLTQLLSMTMVSVVYIPEDGITQIDIQQRLLL